MMNVTIQSNLEFPAFDFQTDLAYVAEKIFIPLLKQYIQQQVSIDGGSYPELEPSTMARKDGQTYQRLLKTEKTLSKNQYVNIAGYGKQLLREKSSRDKITQVLAGISSLTLIETGKLIDSFQWANLEDNAILIYLDDDRAAIGGYLQVEGIGKKKKHFNFFGVNTEMEDNAIAYMKQRINEAISDAISA